MWRNLSWNHYNSSYSVNVANTEEEVEPARDVNLPDFKNEFEFSTVPNACISHGPQVEGDGSVNPTLGISLLLY